MSKYRGPDRVATGARQSFLRLGRVRTERPLRAENTPATDAICIPSVLAAVEKLFLRLSTLAGVFIFPFLLIGPTIT